MDKLVDQTDALFAEKIVISEAPTSFLDKLFHQGSSTPTGLDDTLTSNSDKENDGDSDNDDMAVDSDQQRMQKLRRQEIEFEEGLFLDGIGVEALEELIALCKQWIRSGKDDFWRHLNLIAKLSNGDFSQRLSEMANQNDKDRQKSSTKNRSKKGRRSSIRMSVSQGEMDVSSKCLVAILDRLIQRALDQNNIEVGIKAGQAYLNLLQLPGANAYYHIFSNIVLHNVASLIRSPISSLSLFEQQKDNDDEAEQDALTELELKDIYQATIDLISEFCTFCHQVSLKSYGELLYHLISVLVNVSQVGMQIKNQNLKHAKLLPQLRQESQEALSLIIDEKHGACGKICAQMFLELLPLITLQVSFEQSGLNRQLISEADHAVRFVKLILSNNRNQDDLPKDRSVQFQGYVLIQQLAFTVVDKAEFRAFVNGVILGVLPLLDESLQVKYIDWLGKLSFNAKNTLRAFAFDLQSSILMHQSINIDEKSVASIIEVLLNGCADKIPTVRARAITCTGQVLECAMENKDKRYFLQNVQSHFPSFLSTIVRRLNDEKSTVRRTTVGVVKFIIMAHYMEQLNIEHVEFLLKQLAERYKDHVMTIRKSTVRCLTELVTLFPEMETMWNYWIQCCFNSLKDTEVPVQEEAVNCFQDLVLKLDDDQRGIFLDQFCKCMYSSNYTYHSLLSLMIEMYIRKEPLQEEFIKHLVVETRDRKVDAGFWMFLSTISCWSKSGISEGDLLFGWDLLKMDLTQPFCPYVLKLISCQASLLSEACNSMILGELLEYVRAFSAPTALLSYIFAAIQSICKLNSDTLWQVDLMLMLEIKIIEVVDRGLRLKQDQVSKIIFSYGEMALIKPQLVKESICDKLLMLIAAATSNHVIHSSVIQGHVYIALGKIALVYDKLAKQYVPVFARELESSKDVVVRNNAMMTLVDLCKRYTRVVDPYIPTISNCLADSNANIRLQAVSLLTNLLQEDYIKWKGALIFKFLYAVVDVPSVSNMAKTCMLQILGKNSQVIFSSFVDSIFFFNDAMQGRAAFLLSAAESGRNKFSLAGVDEMMQQKRMEVYSFALQHMSDEHRFLLTKKLCTDILKAYVDDAIGLVEECDKSVLIDTLHVLACKDIKSNLKPIKADEEEELSEAAEKKLNAISNKIHSQISRKIAVENIIPIVIKMKHKLESIRSPLLKHLMIYLREVVSDFRVEMEDILASDRQLAQEIEFDLRQYS
ncbi:hypothetical protein MP228_007030 [Amoeboaphelidium protococcarum]|nr:hypothetical protein MP228_007030 [Amoeboaphelidium protococcarum]